MKKKLLTLLLASGCLGFFSCLCSDVLPFWKIEDFSIDFQDTQNNNAVDGTIATDTLVIAFTFAPEFVAFQQSPSSLFINSAMAFQCDDPGRDGLKDPISDFKLTSDTNFNGIPPGGAIKNFYFEVSGYGTSFDKLSDWLHTSEEWGYPYNSTSKLFLTEKPLNQSVHTFTVHMTFSSGKILEKELATLDWQ